MPANFRIVTLGDSVPWGQGLLQAEKYDVLVAAALGSRVTGVVLDPRIAHSGAVIGANGATGPTAPGEVPIPRPTIMEQIDLVNSPGTVDLVLINGGINDIGVSTILDPFDLIPSLQSRIKKACFDGMVKLLQKAVTTFTKASCKILVTGYYTILSAKSDPLESVKLLRMHNIRIPDKAAEDLGFLNPIVRRCEEFFTESTTQLKNAIQRVGDNRVIFVPSGFTDDNAVFVPGTSLLWGLKLDLSPQDPVAPVRIPQCDLAHPGDAGFFDREKCHRASAGHPNVQGAVQYSNQILAALP